MVLLSTDVLPLSLSEDGISRADVLYVAQAFQIILFCLRVIKVYQEKLELREKEVLENLEQR